MFERFRYKLLEKGERDETLEESNTWSSLTTHERLRLHVGGFLFIGLGLFIIWRTTILVLSLLAFEPPMHALLGWSDTRYVFVFGDSLSSIEYDVNGPPPDESNPIGNPPYPGWTTSGGANWVGYLSTEYNQSTVLTHDFAQSGGVVQWVEQQVNEHFLPFAGRQPDWAPWTANDSLFVTWIGTNDVMQWKDIQGQLTLLFQLQEKLFDAGARNFVYFTVPPFDRSPIQNAKGDDNLRYRIAEWNNQLQNFVGAFMRRHCSVSVAIYDSNALLTDVLDHPKKYGFEDEWAVCHEAKCVWNDGIHPTFAMHKLWAEDLANSLLDQQ